MIAYKQSLYIATYFSMQKYIQAIIVQACHAREVRTQSVY